MAAGIPGLRIQSTPCDTVQMLTLRKASIRQKASVIGWRFVATVIGAAACGDATRAVTAWQRGRRAVARRKAPLAPCDRRAVQACRPRFSLLRRSCLRSLAGAGVGRNCLIIRGAIGFLPFRSRRRRGLEPPAGANEKESIISP